MPVTSGTPDPVTQAITDARALIESLLASGFQDMHVVSGETEIFLARPAGRANPMRARPAPAESAVAAVLGAETTVKAPHIATLCATAPLGSMVRAGDTIATLSLLDEEIAVPSPLAGEITGLPLAPGSLVEFDQPIVLLRGAA